MKYKWETASFLEKLDPHKIGYLFDRKYGISINIINKRNNDIV